ncbi:hypothetical protein CSE_03300 [Caldisericum exile AZM16c01]|uniref:Uncharacterized protein n=1 Tax=Caldisericum exile (strain DSM 21853 / NBRC 104410 / AZM16c01) TaxID=511051 RepID=A0A7U6GDM2_CALEA|nr:hypothetical protein CSE_03300 [Caldisericum exile AZM16c01]
MGEVRGGYPNLEGDLKSPPLTPPERLRKFFIFRVELEEGYPPPIRGDPSLRSGRLFWGSIEGGSYTSNWGDFSLRLK